jgi:hypothetical protein
MPDDNDDPFGDDANEALDDFDRLSGALLEHVNAFAEEEDVVDEVLPLLLLRLAVTLRMTNYAVSVAKPSGGGLKLDIERFRRDVDDLIRVSKKDADRFIAASKAAIAASESDEDET